REVPRHPAFAQNGISKWIRPSPRQTETAARARGKPTRSDQTPLVAEGLRPVVAPPAVAVHVPDPDQREPRIEHVGAGAVAVEPAWHDRHRLTVARGDVLAPPTAVVSGLIEPPTRTVALQVGVIEVVVVVHVLRMDTRRTGQRGVPRQRTRRREVARGPAVA